MKKGINLCICLSVIFIGYVASADSEPSVTGAQALANFSVGEAIEGLDGDRWMLNEAGRAVGTLHSIGGKPQLTRAVPMKGPDGQDWLQLYYGAGMAGTRSLSRVERLMVLEQETAATHRPLLDIPVRVEHLASTDQREDLKRELKWQDQGRILVAGELDEAPLSRYVWEAGAFREVLVNSD